MKIDQIKVVSVSGGKDSTALYLLAIEMWGHDFIPIFADTGHEHPVTYNYIRNLPQMAGGPEIHWVQADFSARLERKGLVSSGNPFLDLMLWKGRAPSTKAQFCTEHLKLYPILFWLEAHYPTDEWIMFTGIRAGESFRRSTRQPFEWNEYFDCESVLPMLYTTEVEVFEYLECKGVPPNPLYSLGFERVGCFPCIHARKSELASLPNWVWEKLKYWEQRLGRSWFPSGILPGKPKGYIPSIDEVREWCKTQRGGRQYDVFKQDAADIPSCMSTWGVCE